VCLYLANIITEMKQKGEKSLVSNNMSIMAN